MINTIALAALACTVVFLSVWGGGIFPSSVCIVSALLCFAAAVVVGMRSGKRGSGRDVRVTAVSLAWAGTILLVALSAVPLFGRLDALTGIRRCDENTLVRLAIRDADDLGILESPRLRFSLSRNRAGTLRILLLVITMLGGAVLSASLSPRSREYYLSFLVLLGIAMAVLGFWHQWIRPADKTMWWVFDVPHGHPVGCFVNRSHYASFLAMLAAVSLALFVKHLCSLRTIIIAVFYGVAFLVMSFSIVVSQSRGGLISHAAATVGMLVYLLAKRQPRVAVPLCVAVVLLAACVAVGIAKVPTADLRAETVARISTLRHPTQTASAQSRFGVWRDSIALWKDYALLGVGANGFRMTFTQYRTSTARHQFIQAENEYVELLTEGGLLGVVMVIVVVVLAAGRWRRNAKGDGLQSHVSMAIGGATVVVAVHNGIDFPMHVPLYALVYASIIGLALTAVPGLTEKRCVHIPRVLVLALFCATGLCIATTAAIGGTAAYRTDRSDYVMSADTDELARALIWSPTSWQTWYHFGTSTWKTGKREHLEFGARCVERAVTYDPNNYLLWEAVGWARFSVGDDHGARKAYERMNSLRSWKKAPPMLDDQY
jgi:O-antigen ligase